MATSNNTLTVSENFASLERYENEDEMVFRLLYRVDLAAALRLNLYRINVTVYKEELPEPPPVPGPSSTIDDHIKYNLMLEQHVKNVKDLIVGSATDDLTKYMSNVAVSSGDVGLIPSTRKQVAVPVTMLGSTPGEVVSMVLDESNIDYSNINLQRLMYDLVFKDGIDPSEVVYDRSKNSNLETLAGSLTENNVINNSYAIVSQMSVGSIKDAYVDVKLKKSNMSMSGTAVVVFELLDSKRSIVVSSIKRKFDYAEHIRVAKLPLNPPAMSYTVNPTTAVATIKIKQVDKYSNGVRIFSKNFRGPAEQDSYTLFGSYELSYGNELSLNVPEPLKFPTIYRAVSTAESSLGHEFTNIAVSPRRYSDMNEAIITTVCAQGGIEVTVNHVPPTANVVTIVRRDLTLKEKTWTYVGESTLVNVDSTSYTAITATDVGLIPGHLYEYSLNVQHRSGVANKAGKSVIEYIPSTVGTASLSIDNFTTSTTLDGTNVKFDIVLSLNDTDESIFLSLLDAAGIRGLDPTQINSIKKNLNDLITCRVRRNNLTTGEIDDFGVFSSKSLSFSEQEFREKRGIKPPSVGHRYRYVVSALVRDAETFVNSEGEDEKEIVKRGRAYRYNPRKFHHPAVVSSGTVFTDNGLRTLFSKSDWEFGEIGLYAYVDLDLSITATPITEIRLTQFDRNTNLITWKYSGDRSTLDHFMVAKRVMGIQTMLGKVHSLLNDGNYFYYHNFDKPDVGTLQYVVIPIYNDYVVGNKATTSEILVGAS